ncbi:MFS transporter [Streptomyces sp900116325]|uniref:MFS transporter n=1 Tax=Streptomyces sp. 900116325 TaxID=3154295 RepID=UPI0033D05DD4
MVQGVGGGLMLPVLQTLLLRAAGGRRIGQLMAVVTLPALVGPILGPVIGGLIAGHLSWRWIFYINVPLCTAAIVLAWRSLTTDASREGHRLDLTGLLLLSPAMAALVYGLSQVGNHGAFNDAHAAVPLVAGMVLLAGFVYRAAGAASPLIDLGLFRNRSFSASAGLLFLSGFSTFGPMLVLPLYFQQVRHQGVVGAGVLLAPQGVGSLLARKAGSLTDRLGPRPVILAGVALTIMGSIPFVAADNTSAWLLAGALVIRGIGLSSANMAVMTGAFQGLTPAQIPHASSATRIMQQIGGAFGIAALAAILQRELADHSGRTMREVVAFHHTFAWALALTALSVLPALLLPRLPSKNCHPSPDPTPHNGTPTRDTTAQ